MSFTDSILVEITREPIDTAALLRGTQPPECGAVVLFLGTTRQWTGDTETTYLEYDAYESMALSEMQSLAMRAIERWSLRYVVMIHRLGRVDIGEASVAIAVGSAHRASAFEAGEWLIDTLKESVPIWKRDNFPSGASEWLHPSGVRSPNFPPQATETRQP